MAQQVNPDIDIILSEKNGDLIYTAKIKGTAISEVDTSALMVWTKLINRMERKQDVLTLSLMDGNNK